MSGEIEYFRFEIEPWHYNGRESQWRICMTVNGMRHDYVWIMPKIPFNKTAAEIYIRSALDAYASVGEEREAGASE